MSTIAWNAGSEPASAARPRAVAPAQARMRLTRRGRVVMASFAVALAFGIGAIAGQAQASGTDEDVAVETIVVTPGQTLWEIANGVAGDRDVRDVIAMIERINALDSTDLEVGQVLEVPSGS